MHFSWFFIYPLFFSVIIKWRWITLHFAFEWWPFNHAKTYVTCHLNFMWLTEWYFNLCKMTFSMMIFCFILKHSVTLNNWVKLIENISFAMTTCVIKWRKKRINCLWPHQSPWNMTTCIYSYIQQKKPVSLDANSSWVSTVSTHQSISRPVRYSSNHSQLNLWSHDARIKMITWDTHGMVSLMKWPVSSRKRFPLSEHDLIAKYGIMAHYGEFNCVCAWMRERWSAFYSF